MVGVSAVRPHLLRRLGCARRAGVKCGRRAERGAATARVYGACRTFLSCPWKYNHNNHNITRAHKTNNTKGVEEAAVEVEQVWGEGLLDSCVSCCCRVRAGCVDALGRAFAVVPATLRRLSCLTIATPSSLFSPLAATSTIWRSTASPATWCVHVCVLFFGGQERVFRQRQGILRAPPPPDNTPLRTHTHTHYTHYTHTTHAAVRVPQRDGAAHTAHRTQRNTKGGKQP